MNLARRLIHIERRLNEMATRAEIDAAKVLVDQKITECNDRVTANEKNFTAQIEALRTQLAGGEPITDQDLIDLSAFVPRLEAIAPAPAPAPAA